MTTTVTVQTQQGEVTLELDGSRAALRALCVLLWGESPKARAPRRRSLALEECHRRQNEMWRSLFLPRSYLDSREVPR